MQTQYRNKMSRLFRDYGYERLPDGRVIRKGIRGFTSDEFLPWKFQHLSELALHIYHMTGNDQEFYARWKEAETA